MATEIPQELLDEMMWMENERFEEFEKAWHNNEHQKKEYEKQYYNQLSGYLLYNKTFKEEIRPLQPREYAETLDRELLSRAKMHNIEKEKQHQLAQSQPQGAVKPQPPTLEELRKEYGEAKYTITERLMAKLPSTKLLERTPEEPSIEKERIREIEREIEM